MYLRYAGVNIDGWVKNPVIKREADEMQGGKRKD